jgi:hypothetical protein
MTVRGIMSVGRSGAGHFFVGDEAPLAKRNLPLVCCPVCRTRPARGRRIIFVCRVCRRLCCDRCMRKGTYLAYCPHCDAPASLIPIGRTRRLV